MDADTAAGTTPAASAAGPSLEAGSLETASS